MRLAIFVLAAAAASASVQSPLASPFFDWETLKVRPTKIGEGRAIANALTPTLARFEFHATTLRSGCESHPPHHHPQEELIVVKNGTLEVSINGNKTRAHAGALFFFASHDRHNMTNVGDAPATYYVINFFTRATAAVRNQPAAQWAPAGLLHSSVIAWEQLVPKLTPTGVRRVIVDSPTLTFAQLEIHATTLDPRAPAGKLHHHPWVELVIVKDGSLEARVGDVTHVARAGSAFFVASNIDQSYSNPTAQLTTYYVISVVSAETPKPAQS